MARYSEPKRDGIRISQFWIAAIAQALAGQHGVTIARGSAWAVDISSKRITYTDDIGYLDKDGALALLLHEIGHVKHTGLVDTGTAAFAKYPETSMECINAIEDTRIDWIMSGEYGNSRELMEAMRRNSYIGISSEWKERKKKSAKAEEKARYASDAFRLAKEGKIIATKEEIAGLRDEAEIAERKLERITRKLSPVTEVMMLYLLAYDAGMAGIDPVDLPELASSTDLLERSRKVLEAHKECDPELMGSVLEVQSFFESRVLPIIEDLIEKNPDGSEKNGQHGQRAADSAAEAMGIGIAADGSRNRSAQERAARMAVRASESASDVAEAAVAAAIGGKGISRDDYSDMHADVDYEAYRSQIAGMISASSARFSRILKDNSFGRYSGRHRSGRIAKKRLFRHASGDYRLFQRKTERKNRSYAFSIMLDCSGSMSGSPIRESMKGVALLSEVLMASGIAFEARFFSDGDTVGKEFGESLSRKKMSAMASRVWGAGTQIVSPFRKMCASLAARPEEQAIAIVLTDGEIDSSESVSIGTAMRKHPGVMFYGIGIGVDLGGIFGDRAISVRNASEIVPAFGSILKRHIRIG